MNVLGNCQQCGEQNPCNCTRPTATAPVEALMDELGGAQNFEKVGLSFAGVYRILSAALTAAEQRGAERERGKVVDWMKGPCVPDHSDEGGCPFDKAANALETGAHDG